jgi:biopolymer transport protein ExbD
MSASIENLGDGSGGPSQDFDLNIAPIIDCFTVLIAYLLISASFLSIGFFDVGVSTTSEVTSATVPKTPQEFMAVELQPDGGLLLKLTGPETSIVTLPSKSGRDFEGLLRSVRETKARFADLSEASVSAGPKVEYREVIQTIEALKKELTKVYVGE